MPLTAINQDKQRILAIQHKSEWQYTCPDCDSLMVHRSGSHTEKTIRQAHFAHRQTERGTAQRDCSFTDESEEHRSGKALLLEWAAKEWGLTGGELEHRFFVKPSRKRIADVHFPDDPERYAVAFEVQRAKITFSADGSGKTIEERTADYHAAGIHVFWCFLERGNGPWTGFYESCKRLYGGAVLLSSDGCEVLQSPQVWLALVKRHPSACYIDALTLRCRLQAQEIHAATIRQEVKLRDQASKSQFALRNQASTAYRDKAIAEAGLAKIVRDTDKLRADLRNAMGMRDHDQRLTQSLQRDADVLRSHRDSLLRRELQWARDLRLSMEECEALEEQLKVATEQIYITEDCPAFSISEQRSAA